MGKISILAVIVGGVVDFVMTITLLVVLTLALSVGHRKITVIPHTTPMRTLQFFLGCACGVFGAYLAAALAKRAHILNGVLAASWMSLFTPFLLLGHKNTTPLFWIVLGYIATPLTGALGGWLAQRTHA